MSINIAAQGDKSQSSIESSLRRRGRAVLPQADHKQLRQHLERCERNRGPSWTLLAYVLQDKLVNSLPVNTKVDRDIVIGGSFVAYIVDGGATASGFLVHELGSGIQRDDVIRVDSLLGATLIGMQTGQRAPLLCEDGTVKSLIIVDTIPPTCLEHGQALG